MSAGLITDGSQSRGFETQAGKVYSGLRDSILNGKLKLGERLVRRTLGKQYGTSAIAAAEALWKLEYDGLVESEPMYGSRVARFTLEQVRGESLLRQALETEVARLCAQNPGKLPVDELMADAQKIDAVMSVKRERHRPEDMEKHFDFHMKLASHCGSQPIVDALNRVWFRHLMIFNWMNSATFPVPPDWHQVLVRAILTGDPDYADSVMRKHTEYGRNHQDEVLSRFQQEIESVSNA